ncbi:hypothetical protein ACFL43_02130 [Thermodesulfobacteriota bacterium]
MLIIKKEIGDMRAKTHYALVLLACAALACAGGTRTTKSSLEAAQLRLADKYISFLANNDYEAAFGCFSPPVQKKFPLGLFLQIQNTIKRSIGKPVSYTCQGETDVIPQLQHTANKPSKSYLYHVVFKKADNKKMLPLVLTFDSGEFANRLLAFKYLQDKVRLVK